MSGSNGGFFDTLGTALSNPAFQGLLGLTAGFGQAAMPQPYKGGTPWGATLGMGAQGLGQGLQNAYKMKLEQNQAQGLDISNKAAASQLPLTLAKNKMLTDIWNNPSLIQSLIGGENAAAAPSVGPVLPVQRGATGTQSSGAPPMSMAPALSSISDPAARTAAVNAALKSGLPPSAWAPWIAAVHNESGWNLGEKDGSSGEIGPGQVMPETGKGMGFTPEQLRDPQTNLLASAKYFGQKWKESNGDPLGAFAGYNTGSVKGDAPQYVALAKARLGQWGGDQGAGVTPVADPSGTPPVAPQQDAMASYQQYEQRARAASVKQMLGIPSGEDPAVLHATAQQYLKLALAGPQATAEAQAKLGPELAVKGFRTDSNGNQVPIPGGPADPAFVGANAAAEAAAKSGVTLQTAGPIAGAEAAAKFPFTQERVSPGGVLAVGGKPAFSVPQKGEEVITTGPNTGMKGQVYRDPMSGAPIVPPEGSAAIPGVPPGFLPTGLAPNVEKRLEEIPKTQAEFIRDDKKIVEGDLENTIDSVNPVKQQLFQLRSLAPDAATGAGGEWRAAFKNWVQTFAPNLTQYVGDASPSQEFKKIALMGAGKQERSDLGARGGFRAMELYLNANPNLEMQPTANRDMANALLVSAQYHRDYAEGASQFFNKNFRSVMDPQNPKPYEPLTSYDSAFIKKMTPELYSNAIAAINGKPYATWAKGLAPDQVKIVGGILQRTDPNAIVDVDGKQRPVSAFTSTIGPFDIAPAERQ